MRLEKRVRALEARLITEPAILHFEDGSTRKIPGNGDYLLNLFIAACDEKELTLEQREQLEWVRQCVGATQPGGGHMIDMVRCALYARTECASEEEA